VGYTQATLDAVLFDDATMELGFRAKERVRAVQSGPLVFSHEGLYPSGEIIADTAEDGSALLFGAWRGSRIFNRPMQVSSVARKDGAGLPRIVADGDYVIEGLSGELVHRFLAVPRNIDGTFAHDANGFGTDLLRLRARAVYLEAVPGRVAEKTFRHLAAGGITGAQNENSSFVGHRGTVSFMLREWAAIRQDLPLIFGVWLLGSASG
jgi:hypothetical protein